MRILFLVDSWIFEKIAVYNSRRGPTKGMKRIDGLLGKWRKGSAMVVVVAKF